jgi:sterol desaturase/sphingolipid hydroxylase (fatty acid hydroxylase superfamily)
MPTSILFLKAWFGQQPGFVRNAVIALLLTSLYWPLIWFIERRWGSGVKHYRSRNFSHDFAYWLYYRFGIHYLLFELWIFVPLNSQLSFLRLDLFKLLPVPIEWVLSYVVFDFIAYWMHRWQHYSSTLWAFHALHHTQENLSFATQVRVHPLDRLITGFCVMVPALVLGSQTMIWTLFVVKDFVTCLQHAQVNWAYGRFYNVFVSPAFHRVHHSRLDSEQRSNYGVALSVWDYLFGTAKPVGTHPAVLGTQYPCRSLWRQMLLPFRILASPRPDSE